MTATAQTHSAMIREMLKLQAKSTANARGFECAQACLVEILDLHRKYLSAVRNDRDVEEIEERAREMAAGISIRSHWVSPGKDLSPAEFLIELAGGGPAARLCGDLDHHCQPDESTCHIEWNDWGIPWQEFPVMNPIERAALCWFASLHWFGEC